MRILVLALALLPPAALAADRDPPRPAKPCKVQPQMAARPEPQRPQKLNELPDAEAFYAVYRTQNGCETPLKVREYRRR